MADGTEINYPLVVVESKNRYGKLLLYNVREGGRDDVEWLI